MTLGYVWTRLTVVILLMIHLLCIIRRNWNQLKQLLIRNQNKLSLNSDKSKKKIHSQRRTLNYDVISIKFNGKKLYPVDNIKYLGMYIDKYLSWNYHILQLSKNFDIMHLLKHVYKYIMLYFIPTLFMDVIFGVSQQKKI